MADARQMGSASINIGEGGESGDEGGVGGMGVGHEIVALSRRETGWRRPPVDT